MAIIDVDRHILSEIMSLQIKIKLASAKYQIEWERIIEVRDKTDALLFSAANPPEAEFKALRNKIYRATRMCARHAQEIAGYVYKQEALMMHLITKVLESDTGKGQENGNIMDESVDVG